ncbi:uncharacterized protein [Rhodnius prolixus]|uniref:uncharacterized protein n=1 Tax=Rhodnius prolixus TaxID=13249 RepID=UPI003D18BF4C
MQATVSMATRNDVPHASRRDTKLYKWGLTFSGEETGCTLAKFLEDVDMRMVSRSVSQEEVFRGFDDLLTGMAKIWFRAKGREFSSWQELVHGLKKTFQDPDYDDRLMEEIRRRTQGSDETPSLFIAKMASLFNRLSTPLTEEQKLRILEKNIKRDHLPHLAQATY